GRVDVGQVGVLIRSIEIADGDFAGERARELERGPDLHGNAVGIAVGAGAVDRQVVNAGIDDDFAERLDARRDFVAAAQYPGILIVVTVRVALTDVVGEQRVLPVDAVDGSLERNVEAIEALPDPERCADVGIDRQFGEIGGDVWAAGIIGRQYVTSLHVDARIFAHIDAAVGAGVEIGTIGVPDLGIVV